MEYFQTKNPNLVKFLRVLQGKVLVYILLAIWCHLVYFVAIWYISWLFGILFPRFGMLYQEKSGNPDMQAVDV
jgi:hypothetical protein